MFKILFGGRGLPAQSTESFSGKTILLTGANVGLGFEAAKKLATSQTTRLILTARSISRGEEAKKQIQSWLAESNVATNTEIIVAVLDMSTAEGVQRFVQKLKSKTDILHAAILNAGMSQPFYEKSSDGFEKVIQVNTLSTVLLGLSLLPLLLSTADRIKEPTQLTFVSSGTATRVQLQSIEACLSEEHPVSALSAPENFTPGLSGGGAKYAQSKLLLEYAMRRIATLPSLSSDGGDPKVLINSVCPGFCKSSLARNYSNAVYAIAMPIVYGLFARTAEQGSNMYISALTRGKEGHGKLWRHDQFEPEWDAISSDEGIKFGDNVWKEIIEIVTGWDPSLKTLL